MLLSTLQEIFFRDINRLKSEIELYQNEADIWRIEKHISNSAGNLCLHLIGNLNAFIGAALGNTNYVRNRALEFSEKGVPRTELLNKIDETILVVNQSLQQLSEDDLKKDFPVLVFEEKTTTEFFLVHLATHLTYHLGQINYHRRLL
ncbi:MAG: DUF1572 family protein [Saprospiraceae bacterium]|nr:DUF1572 family protein [Saprospiraceae bacterium]